MLDIASLQSSLGDDAPSGADLEYDPEFAALEQAGAGKPEQQYGDTIIPAEEPDWPVVNKLAQALAGRTRDLRVAVWLVRSEARLHGLAGGAQALALVNGLLSNLWDSLHPQLDTSDNNDPTMRMNALAPLASGEAALADLRAASVTGSRGGLTLRDLELALGRAEPGSNESVPNELAAMDALGQVLAQQPALADTVAGGLQAVRDMARLLDDKVGSQGPELNPLIKLLKVADDAVRRALGTDSAEAAADPGAEGTTEGAAAPAGGRAMAVPGAINSREDVMRLLEKASDWLERHEPSHPAPLLIRRAHRLMSKNFIEIMQDMTPDGISQLRTLAGPDVRIES